MHRLLQVLRAVQALAAGPDDLHAIISAHGSFAGALTDLCIMNFPLDVRAARLQLAHACDIFAAAADCN